MTPDATDVMPPEHPCSNHQPCPNCGNCLEDTGCICVSAESQTGVKIDW